MVPLPLLYQTAATNRLRMYLTPLSGNGFGIDLLKHLTQRRADPNVDTMRGESLLSFAVKRNDVKAVEYLIQIDEVRQNIDRRDGAQQTALHHAKSSLMVRKLLGAGANPEALDKF